MVPLRSVRSAVEALRADPASHDRLLGPEGRSYTPAEAGWIREQLLLIADACRRGRVVEAAWRIEDLQTKLNPGPARSIPTRVTAKEAMASAASNRAMLSNDNR
jgi:hypothetical protein